MAEPCPKTISMPTEYTINMCSPRGFDRQYYSEAKGPHQGSMMAKANPLQFVQQVRSEVSKVVWPSRREVMVTSVMVFIMAMLTALFFFFIDWAIRIGLQVLLGFFG